jgi:hypothetical protein
MSAGLLQVIVGVSLKVAVIAESMLSVIVPLDDGHGFVVPPQLPEFRLPLWALHPPNVEPGSATAVIRYVSLFLNLNVPLPLQLALLPDVVQLPVGVSGVSPVPIREKVTVPPPAPAFV